MKFTKFLEEIYSDNSDLEDYDKALSAYTLNPMELYKIHKYFDELMYHYANEKQITIYRGLNFETKEQYDEFVSSIKNGKVHFKRISSWSPDKSEATSFAITRPSYMEFMDSDNMKAISLARKNHEHVVGYRGIILKTKIEPNTGIDVRRSKFSKESEIILPAGTYKVSFENKLKNSDRMGEYKNLLDAVMDAIKENSDNSTSFLEHIIMHHHEKFTDVEKTILGNHFLKIKVDHMVEYSKPLSFINKDGTIEYYLTSDNIAKKYAHVFLEKDIDAFYKKYKPVLRKLYNDLEKMTAEYPDANIKNMSTADITTIFKKCGEEVLYKKFNVLLGKKLVKLTSHDKTKEINSLSGKEQAKAINKLKDDLLAALKAFS